MCFWVGKKKFFIIVCLIVIEIVDDIFLKVFVFEEDFNIVDFNEVMVKVLNIYLV